MDYSTIINNGYNTARHQGTSYVSYFKREAQKAKRDDFCENSDFFNGCKRAVLNYMNNIQLQLYKEQQENKHNINL
jgi:hypothetical protein